MNHVDPPCVIKSIAENALNELMNLVINTNISVGDNSGTVIFLNILNLLALSNFAASYTYAGN